MITVFSETGSPLINIVMLEEVTDDEITIFLVEFTLLRGETALVGGELELLLLA